MRGVFLHNFPTCQVALKKTVNEHVRVTPPSCQPQTPCLPHSDGPISSRCYTDPTSVMISDTENVEPQNALTSKFTPAEWTALREFRVGIVTYDSHTSLQLSYTSSHRLPSHLLSRFLTIQMLGRPHTQCGVSRLIPPIQGMRESAFC